MEQAGNSSTVRLEKLHAKSEKLRDQYAILGKIIRCHWGSDCFWPPEPFCSPPVHEFATPSYHSQDMLWARIESGVPHLPGPVPQLPGEFEVTAFLHGSSSTGGSSSSAGPDRSFPLADNV